MPRFALLMCLPALLIPSVGCKQMMKGADEAFEVGRRVDVPTGRVPHVPAAAGERVVGKVSRAAVEVGLEKVLELAAKEGVTPAADLPDMAGAWNQKDDLGDGMATDTRIQRTATAQSGVYTIKVTIAFSLDSNPLMTIHIEGMEVLSLTQQCQWPNSLSVDYPNTLIKDLLETTGEIPTLEEISKQPPCDPLRTITADLISGEAEGERFTEYRVR